MLKDNVTICGRLISSLTSGSEKKVVCICDMCGLESIVIWHNYTESQKKKNNSGLTYCKLCTHEKFKTVNIGRPGHSKGKRFPELSGSKSKRWKGGSYIGTDGYRLVHIGNDDQEIKWNNYRKEHMVIMEKVLGRPLQQGEIIHHIDGNKLNNNPENLVLFPDEKTHRQTHNQLERLSMRLVRLGYIIFDKNTNTYTVADIKLRELLEQPEEVNQQPSLESDFLEGSTTRYVPSQVDDEISTSSEH